MNRNQNDDSEWMKQHKSNLKYIMLSQDKNMCNENGRMTFLYCSFFSVFRQIYSILQQSKLLIIQIQKINVE